jgi:hypothetical protein
MNINFRQGIISNQKLPKFLQYNKNGNIDFDASVSSTILNFADGSSNYLYIEATSIKDAWTNLTTGVGCWLYWDISTVDASRTFGYTPYNPFSTTIPTAPQINEMYFDLPSSKYKEWTGLQWRNVIRVIAGYIDTNNKITIQSTGSQINLQIAGIADIIVLDNTKLPIKKYTTDGFEFYNKYTITNSKNDSKDSFNYNSILNVNGQASENITKHYCVSWLNYNTLQVSDPSKIDAPSFAIVEEAALTGDIVKLHYQGFVINKTDWNWPYPPNTELFVGNNGQLTITPDATYSVQKIGYIVSPNTIYVDFRDQYVYSLPSH